jgi:hypothetical protein
MQIWPPPGDFINQALLFFRYHCECLSPPLGDIPVEEWFCPDCAQTDSGMVYVIFQVNINSPDCTLTVVHSTI